MRYEQNINMNEQTRYADCESLCVNMFVLVRAEMRLDFSQCLASPWPIE
jgi:hypothetical protein